MIKTVLKNNTQINIPYEIKRDVSAWEAIRGIWKGKKTLDAVKWQREIRKEWDRKLS